MRRILVPVYGLLAYGIGMWMQPLPAAGPLPKPPRPFVLTPQATEVSRAVSFIQTSNEPVPFGCSWTQVIGLVKNGNIAFPWAVIYWKNRDTNEVVAISISDHHGRVMARLPHGFNVDTGAEIWYAGTFVPGQHWRLDPPMLISAPTTPPNTDQ